MTVYTYEIDGVIIRAEDVASVGVGITASGMMNTALSIAAVISFQRSRPVIIKFQGQPYRRVTVEFVDKLVTPYLPPKTR